ncbi:hypothetical protein C0995_000447 [Termitomyces sp. Mi166|nr:hypothetical protein C0995_000447 [Termitomyces sp. Mi166\
MFSRTSLSFASPQIYHKNIALAKEDVWKFAEEIIRWVDHVKKSFEKAGKGRFTSITWDNLADMRANINMQKDDRWKLKNAKIEGEIADFRARLDEVHKAFNDRSLIVISGGLDAIIQFLWTLFFGQYILIIALENLQKTQDEHFKRILKELERRNFLEGKLGARTVDDPSYITQNKDPCDPGTRRAILEEIKTWINDHSKETSKNFLWLVGPPGCGKSAITASIVEYCQSHEILGAQFFINRNNYDTTNPRRFFPTVARDLYKRSESVEQHLYDALKNGKFSVDTPEKAADVFLDVVGKAARDSPDVPIVIVFDGLDETMKDRLESTAVIFSRLFTKLPDYPNAKILISSRPEGEILRPFRDPTSYKHVQELEIDINDENSHRDIRKYMERRLTESAKKYCLPSSVWPGDERLEKLVERASGLFIWAVTAYKYIDQRLRRDGTEALNAVLDRFHNAAMMDINTLYLTILEDSYPPGHEDEWTLEKFRRLVGAILVLREPMNIRDLRSLLDLRETCNSDPVDVRAFVDNLRTLLVADLDDVTDNTIPRAHKSFFDFITNTGDHIPDHFRIDVVTSNAEMALACLCQLTIAYSDAYATHYALKESDLKTFSVPVRYSLRFGLSHMPEQQGTSLGILSDHPRLFDESFQLDELLRCFSHLNDSPGLPLVFSVPSDHAFIRTSLDDYDSLIWNLEDGSTTTPTSVAINPRLLDDLYREYVFFDEAEERVRVPVPKQFYGLIKGFSWDRVENDQNDRRFPRDHLIQHPSFDGTRIAFARTHGPISFYTPAIGTVQSSIPNRHTTELEGLWMSQNCSYIASVSKEENRSIIDVWDINHSCYINKPTSMAHESRVEYMEFSPDETLLILYDGQRAYIWEIPTCKRKGHSVALRVPSPTAWKPVAFSPNSQTVLAGTAETVFLWDPLTGEQIGKPWRIPPENSVQAVYAVAFRSRGDVAFATDTSYNFVVPRGVQFTPDGSQLLYREGQGRLGIHNITPLLLSSTNTFKPKWTVLSPKGNLIVSIATDEILCWKLDAVEKVRNPLKRVTTSIITIAFSTDETRIAGAAEDGTVYLWDSTTCDLLSSLSDSVHAVSSLSFSPDGTHIVAKLADDQLAPVLSVGHDDILAISGEDESRDVRQKVEAAPKLTVFDLNKKSSVIFGTDAARPNRLLKNVRWYPSQSDSVVWAYVNNHIIRARKDGRFVVIPVGNLPSQ